MPGYLHADRVIRSVMVLGSDPERVVPARLPAAVFAKCVVIEVSPGVSHSSLPCFGSFFGFAAVVIST